MTEISVSVFIAQFNSWCIYKFPVWVSVLSCFPTEVGFKCIFHEEGELPAGSRSPVQCAGKQYGKYHYWGEEQRRIWFGFYML